MIIECVPNFSEGRRREVLDEIAAVIGRAPGVRLLDVHADADHNRSVFTYVGTPAGLRAASLGAVKKAVERIDLTSHRGTHPRMGACDVLPFVPIADASMEDCRNLAREMAAALGGLGIPVFLYGKAAARPERQNLADIRNRHQFEGLAGLIGSDPAFDPDAGPKKIHPTAGATAVGAREALIAYNVNLEGGDVELARAIAKKIRERDGGMPGVRALGMRLEERGIAQVSMNVCDHRKAPLIEVFREVERLAREGGAGVRSSELVGMLPRAAWREGWEEALKLEGFSSDRIIENRL